MNRDEFYTAMAPCDDARLRKLLWTLYWRGNVQLRERIEDELRPPEQPKVKRGKERPDAAGRADPGRPRAVYGSFDETRYRRGERAKDLDAWHEMLLDQFAGTPEDELLDRLAASPALAGPELTFLRARIAERRGDIAQAGRLITECLKELPGDYEYLDFAVGIGAALPPRAREIHAERAAAEALIAQAYRDGRVPSD